MDLTSRPRARAAARPSDDADDGEPGALADDHGADAGALGSEGEADADLVGALGDGVGHDAVDADAGEGEGEDAEADGEGGEDALLLGGGVDLLLLGADVDEGEVFVDALDCGAERRGDGFGWHGGADDVGDAADAMLLAVEIEVKRVGLVAQAVVVDIGGDAYDLIPDAAVGVIGGAEAFADGVLVGKELLCGGLRDDGDGAGGFGVLRGEGAAGDDGDAHDLNEIGPYAGEVRATAEIVPSRAGRLARPRH